MLWIAMRDSFLENMGLSLKDVLRIEERHEFIISVTTSWGNQNGFHKKRFLASNANT